TADRAWRYRQSLGDRNVAPAPEAIANLRRFDEPLPAGPTDPEAVIALLDEAGSPATMGSAGGRFFGFVVGSSLPATVAAKWMAGAWDQDDDPRVLIPGAGQPVRGALPWTVGAYWLAGAWGPGVGSGVLSAGAAQLGGAGP